MINHDEHNKCEDVGCCNADDPRVKEAVDEILAEMDIAGIEGVIDTPATGGHGEVQRVTARINKKDGSKLGRNDPCLCGSTKKLKKCCWDLLNG